MKTFWQTRTGFLSRSNRWDVSPVFMVATTAANILNSGGQVELPEGYDLESLSSITWLTGQCDVDVRVSPRQADEVLAIARELVAHHRQEIPGHYGAAISEFIDYMEARADDAN